MTSDDGLIGSAKLMPNQRIIQRPLNKIFPLEIRSCAKDQNQNSDNTVFEEPSASKKRHNLTRASKETLATISCFALPEDRSRPRSGHTRSKHYLNANRHRHQKPISKAPAVINTPAPSRTLKPLSAIHYREATIS
ncbi:hypothetical protein RB195_006797 [Necator americanus]